MIKHKLGIVDYVVIAISLLISISIGIFLRYRDGKQTTTKQFLLAGKNMSKIPVILSVIVTWLSPVTVISAPAEIYQYGFQMIVSLLSIFLGMIIASYVFIPVYYQCEVSTVNQFLEMRFGKHTRTLVSMAIFVQMLVFMAVSIYGSVLALSAVTNLSMEMSIVSLGVVCTFYCSLGGLKAVLWTDVYQSILIFICLISIYVVGIQDGGGISDIFIRSYEGGRLNIFDFELEFFRRYTFWNSFSKGLIFGLFAYGVSQVEVQRLMSLSDAKRARSTLLLSVLPVITTYFFCAFFGVILYAIFYQCDPILNKKETGLSKYDQMIPYYIVKRFNSLPGMTGLCIAGIFSATLGTVSSALNSLTTVTVVDFIRPIVGKIGGQLSDNKMVYIAKILSLLYGGICIALTFSFLGLASLVQISNAVVNMVEGTMLGVFLLGVLSRKGSDKVVSISFFISFVLMSWISVGSLYSGYVPPPLPVNTDMCPNVQNYSSLLSNFSNSNNHNDIILPTQIPSAVPKTNVFILYKISFMWHAPFGLVLSLALVTIGILLTGWRNNVVPKNSKCLSPVAHFWIKTSDDDGCEDEQEQRNCHATATTSQL